MHDPRQSRLTLRDISVIVSAAISVAAFLCPQRTFAQVTVGNIVIPADQTQPVSGNCGNFNSLLSTTGVSANGQSHPGRCRSTTFTPLFDGIPLGNDMQAFLNSPTHPPLFTMKITPKKGQYCATNSKLKVTLSGLLQASRLQWTGAPVIGFRCTDEVARVNTVSSGPSPAVVQAMMSNLLRRASKELVNLESQQLSGCGFNPSTAALSLDEQVWNLLQRVATDEVRLFEAWVGPAIDNSDSCAAKCNLCFTGWVGNIQCTAKVDQLSYQWKEVQNWDVGGPPTTGTMGSTVYPANFTATGGGFKLNGPRWTINATTLGTLTDGGVNANKRFSTSNQNVPMGITWSDGNQPSAEGEMQLQFNADQLGGNKATNDPMPTLPACINTPQRSTSSIPCSVSCNWNLDLQ